MTSVELYRQRITTLAGVLIDDWIEPAIARAIRREEVAGP